MRRFKFKDTARTCKFLTFTSAFSSPWLQFTKRRKELAQVEHITQTYHDLEREEKELVPLCPEQVGGDKGTGGSPLWNSPRPVVAPGPWSWTNSDVRSRVVASHPQNEAWGGALLMACLAQRGELFSREAWLPSCNVSRGGVVPEQQPVPPENFVERCILRPHPDLLGQKLWGWGPGRRHLTCSTSDKCQ